jgi:hypothetical protein
MIDFAKITKTIDGYDCHYFGERDVLLSGRQWRAHCFAVWHPGVGVSEKFYDDEGRRLSVVCGRLVKSTSNKFSIVEVQDGN